MRREDGGADESTKGNSSSEFDAEAAPWIDVVLRERGGLSQNDNGKSASAQSIPQVLVEKISGYMRSNFRERLDIQGLADYCDISMVTLRRLFKRVLKMSPKEYVMKMRVHEACFLLKNSSSSVLEIALTVGFYDGSALTRQFIRFMGESPSSYRARKHFEVFSSLMIGVE